MSALITQLADAIKDELNSESVEWSQPLGAVRSVLPQYDLEDMDTLHVTVVAGGWQRSRETRAASKQEHRVDIAVQKKITFPDPADEEAATIESQVDTLCGLVEEIANRMDGIGFVVGSTRMYCVESLNDPLYDPMHLAQMHQFTAVLTLGFKTIADA